MTNSDPNDLLTLLLHESAQVRDDERYMSNQQAVVIGSAITLVLGMAVFFYTTCPVGVLPNTEYCPHTTFIAIPIWLYISAMILPIGLLGYAVTMSTTMALRSYYMRVLERRIHELTDQLGAELPIPSWAHIQLEVTGQAHAGVLARLNWYMIYIITTLMVLGACLYTAFFKIPFVRYQIFALIVDVILIGIPMATVVFGTMRGTHLWHQALTELPKRLNRTREHFPFEQRTERSLASFLILPRNQEDLPKALYILMGFVIGRTLPSHISSNTLDILSDFIIFFFVFEFVIYQARYLFNDIRDRYIDCNTKLAKRRFPCSLKDNATALKAAFISFIIRWAIAILLVGCILPIENWRWAWHIGFLISIFLIATLYETIRSRCLTAAKAGSGSHTTMWTVVIIGVVGLGYSLRSVVGLWFAGIDDRVALTLAALGTALLGSTLVALFWALESTRADIDDLSTAKAHLILFRRIVSKTGNNVGPRDRVLAGRQFFTAPWCITAVLATSILATFALYLLHDYFSGVVFSLRFGRISIGITKLVLVAVTVAAIEGLTIIALIKPVKHSFTLMTFIFITLVITLHWSSVPLIQSVVAAVLSTLPMIMSYALRTMCFDDLPGFTDKLINIIRIGTDSLYDWFIRPR